MHFAKLVPSSYDAIIFANLEETFYTQSKSIVLNPFYSQSNPTTAMRVSSLSVNNIYINKINRAPNKLIKGSRHCYALLL